MDEGKLFKLEILSSSHSFECNVITLLVQFQETLDNITKFSDNIRLGYSESETSTKSQLFLGLISDLACDLETGDFD